MTVKVDDRLSAAAGIFETVPCVPVLSDEGASWVCSFPTRCASPMTARMARRSLITDENDAP